MSANNTDHRPDNHGRPQFIEDVVAKAGGSLISADSGSNGKWSLSAGMKSDAKCTARQVQ